MRRECWSATTVSHQQKGHCCDSPKGTSALQSPRKVGTTVMSECQTWCGYSAMIFSFGVVFRVDASGLGTGSQRSMRLIVDTPSLNPFRAMHCAIFIAPKFGQ